MLHIAIVDDEIREQCLLEGHIQRYFEDYPEKPKLSFYQLGEDAVENNAQFDIMFLDIAMKYMDGVQAARRIRQGNPRVILVFVTNLHQRALEGYGVDALDFLVKPVPYRSFSVTMDRALERLESFREKRLEIRALDGLQFVDLNSIVYAETEEKRIRIHTLREEILSRESLQSLEDRLAGGSFFRCHKAYLVNLNFVDAVSGDQVMVAGRPLSLSKYKKKQFLEKMTIHMGRSL